MVHVSLYLSVVQNLGAVRGWDSVESFQEVHAREKTPEIPFLGTVYGNANSRSEVRHAPFIALWQQ